MEKILRWWTQFLLQLEAGKRVIAMCILVIFCLGVIVVVQNKKLEKSEAYKLKITNENAKLIILRNDSCAAEKLRIIAYYNEKTENIYKERLKVIDNIRENFNKIKKTNDNILKNNIK